ncbi:MAG: IS1380 family transposase [Streptosporangiaceae bacterium]
MNTARKQGKVRGRIQIGAPDPSLTPNGGMITVTELCARLGLTGALDEHMPAIKERERGFSGGQVLAGMAAAQLAGEDFLVGLDRLRDDTAGQQVALVPGLATSTASGLARRFTKAQWAGAEKGLAAVTARMMELLPAERAEELAGGGPVTIDIDATDVEVYGTKKQGVAYNYQGQRAGRPHVAAWAETEIPLAADLLAGDQDPRSHVVALLGRALAALPAAVRQGAREAGRKIALRADAGYFAGDLARAAIKNNMEFAIGAKRISSMWRALAGIADSAWRDAIDMHGAQVAVSPYKPADWPGDTVLLIRRVRLDPDQVSADSRSRRRRTLDPRQRALPIPELEKEPEIYAYSFICTNLDVSTPSKAAAVEHWYRHRTVIENMFRDTKHGAALRHLPSGNNNVNTCWMWGSLIAAAIAAFIHQLTGLIIGPDLAEGHGVRGGKAMIATLRRVLIAVPARLVRHSGQLIMRLPPGPQLLPEVLATIRALPAPG